MKKYDDDFELPYSFDLLFDCKTIGQLRYVSVNRLNDVIETFNNNNLELPDFISERELHANQQDKKLLDFFVNRMTLDDLEALTKIGSWTAVVQLKNGQVIKIWYTALPSNLHTIDKIISVKLD